MLQNEGIKSHVVDPASIATSRRRGRAKTDRIDGEALLRALLSHKRGEPRACAMVKAPTPEEEGRRRLSHERKTLIAERVEHVNRIKGLLFCQGVSGCEPPRRDLRQRLGELKTGDCRLLPHHLKEQISRELDRLELLLEQIKGAEAERDALFTAAKAVVPPTPAPVTMLLEIKGIGPEFAATFGWRRFFAASPIEDRSRPTRGWRRRPGRADRSIANGAFRKPAIADNAHPARLPGYGYVISRNRRWLCGLKNGSRNGGRFEKTTIVALARKLLVALRKYVTAGVVIEGAAMKSA